MNRRSFLKFIPAVGLASKTAAKEAIAKASGVDFGLSGFNEIPSGPGLSGAAVDRGWALKKLAEVLDGTYRDKLAENTIVGRLDPDLAAMQSMSISARVFIQKERLIERAVKSERTWLERIIRGEED